VLIPAVLLAQISRPIPRTATLEPNCEEQSLKLTTGVPQYARKPGFRGGPAFEL
jgi:hypothetical protein